MLRSRVLVVLLIGALLVASCSDDDTGASGGSSSEPTSAPADDDSGGDADIPDDERSEEERAADQALAERINITAADLGDDWVSTPADPSSDLDDSDTVELARCIEVEPALIQDTETQADSDQFARGDISVNSNVGINPTEREAELSFDVFDDPDFIPCYEQALLASVTEEVAGEGEPDDIDLSIEPADIAEVGDESASYDLRVKLTAPGQTVELVQTLVFFRVDRAIATFLGGGVGAPIDDATVEHVTQAMAARAKG